MIILNDSLPKADTLDLNPGQHSAATFAGGHALVLAGAGCGKTRTIIARCEYSDCRRRAGQPHLCAGLHAEGGGSNH